MEWAGGLPIGCLSIQTTMLARLSGESRIRRECAARKGWAGDERALASMAKKDGTRLIRAGQLPGKRLKGRRVKRCRCLFQQSDSASVETCQRRRRQAGVPSSEHARPTVHHGPLTTPVRSAPPPPTTTWRIRRIAALGPAKLQG
jgi:hypothetical protein